jgi:hypothetical protein
MKVLGIDNGLEGALVLLDGPRVEKSVMPTMSKPSGKGNEYDIAAIIRQLEAWKPDKAFLEKAQAMPASLRGRQQGGVSSFSTGYGYGVMRGVLAALKIPHELVHPKTWQKLLFADMAKTDTKAASVAKAQQLWPSVDWRATERCKVLHHGLTDAALIAEWGRRCQEIHIPVKPSSELF